MARRRALLALMWLALFVVGCQTVSAKTPKVLPEWSRGQQLGVAALNRPVGISIQDGHVCLVWVAAGGRTLHYVRLDGSGQVEVSADLDVSGAHPSDPQLLSLADGSLGVLWMDNPGMPRALFLATLSADGQILAGPSRLSPEEARVAEYAVSRNRDGSHDIFWADEIPADGGIHYVRLAGDAQVPAAGSLLIANGSHPTLQIALDGTIYMAWVEEPSVGENTVYYAAFDPATGKLGPVTEVASYRTATGLVAYPPALALEDDEAYLFWALEQRGGGMATGEAATHFVSFPIHEPRLTEPRTLDIPGTARPRYGSAAGSLPYGSLAMAGEGWPTSLLYMPSALSGQREEVGVFLVGAVSTRNQTSREVVWAILANGELKGYQLPAKAGNALRPVGAVDDGGDVHLVWLNAGGFGRYEVHYASTSGAVRATLDRISVQDRAMDFLNAMWTLAPAFAFFPPVFLLWGFASFVWVVLFYIIKVEGGLDRRAARIGLVVAVLLYLFSKLFLAPGVLFYAPFVDRVPQHLQFLPVLGTPLFTLLVALGVLALYLRRSEYRSMFAAYVIFVLTDSILSLLIYVPAWMRG